MLNGEEGKEHTLTRTWRETIVRIVIIAIAAIETALLAWGCCYLHGMFDETSTMP